MLGGLSHLPGWAWVHEILVRGLQLGCATQTEKNTGCANAFGVTLKADTRQWALRICAERATGQAIFRPAKYPYTKRTMIAPTTAPIKPAPCPGPYQPSICPRKLATKAPTMPRMAVRMNPCGSLGPGMMNLAITPAINPMMIVQMMPISRSSLV